MTQRALTLLAPLRDPADRAALEADLRAGAVRAVPGLHFLSMFVIPGQPALLGLEANFDRAGEDFLPRLVEANNALLHRAYSRCEGYPAGANDAALVAYLRRMRARAQLFYVGCPGRTVEQILQEEALGNAVAAGMGGLVRPYGRRAEIVRDVFNRLDDGSRSGIFSVPRRPFWVRLGLYTRPLQALYSALQWLFFLAGIPTIALVAAAAAGFPIWPPIHPPLSVIEATCGWARGLATVASVATLLWLLLFLAEFPACLTWRTRFSIFMSRTWEYVWVTARALPAFLAMLGVLALVHWHGRLLLWVAAFIFGGALLALVGYGLWALVRLLRIGRLEPADEVDELAWDPALASRREREDRGLQNHFISVTDIRPGRVRMATLRTVLFAIHWLARILHNPRGLFNTRSIHFARWMILPGRRLLFISNYDGSFGGYLGIFATLGAAGVSAIWSSTVGFPRSFLLFMDGARDEQRFKRRARASQVETLLWHQRYPHLSVAAIERNTAIREELARFARNWSEVPETDCEAFLRRFSTPVP